MTRALGDRIRTPDANGRRDAIIDECRRMASWYHSIAADYAAAHDDRAPLPATAAVTADRVTLLGLHCAATLTAEAFERRAARLAAQLTKRKP